MDTEKEWVFPETKITFKEKVRLLFKPMRMAQDVTRDCAVFTYYKEMDGKIYIIKIKDINY